MSYLKTKKASTGQSKLKDTLLRKNIFDTNSTSKVTKRQRVTHYFNRLKRHILHQSAYLTYQGGINHD